MMTNSAIVEALAGLSREHGLTLAPLLRILAHDLNGALTPLTLEAFALRDLATRANGAAGHQLPADVDAAEIQETLRQAAASLESTANRVSAYLAELRRLVDRRDE